MESLNSDTITNAGKYSQQFQAAKPFAHIAIDDFLDRDFCQALLDEFPSFDKKLAINENGEIGGKAVNEHVRDLGGAFKQMDELAKSDEFLKFVSRITGIKDLIYDPHYFGGGTHENLTGQCLDPHVDFTNHPVTNYYRRLNLIVYLNHNWQSEWGGNIELHKNPRLIPQNDEIISIRPLFNRAVIFETNHTSWHGFPVIDLPDERGDTSRKSFALYFYTKAPVKGFKLPHSTIYVDRHLTAKIKAGYTLGEHDVNEIQRLLSSRDQHLQRLYNTISVLMDKQNKLKMAFGIIWKISWPYRKIRNLFRSNK